MLTVIVVVLLGIGVSTFFKVNGSIGSDKIQLRLAHGQAGDSENGGTIAYLSDLVAEDESMNMEVSIYPSGVLDMAKISANMMVMNLAVGTITVRGMLVGKAASGECDEKSGSVLCGNFHLTDAGHIHPCSERVAAYYAGPDVSPTVQMLVKPEQI